MKSTSHKTWQMSLLFLELLQIQNLKRKSGGGTRPPCPPPNCAHAHGHMQKQEWEYVWHIKLQTSGSSHSGVKATWALRVYGISPFLGTTDNQIGFKASHSTDQCTFLLKQTASYFVTHGLSVNAVFLDASKAFDGVLNIKLFEKLLQRKVPICFVRLLKHWYKEQTMPIKWSKHFSEPFHVSNGIRQGGVLSPYLFAVYLVDMN